MRVQLIKLSQQPGTLCTQWAQPLRARALHHRPSAVGRRGAVLRGSKGRGLAQGGFSWMRLDDFALEQVRRACTAQECLWGDRKERGGLKRLASPEHLNAPWTFKLPVLYLSSGFACCRAPRQAAAPRHEYTEPGAEDD